MEVAQVGKTTNSITINISGITEGDRQTEIWIPEYFTDPWKNDDDWYTLQDAEKAGYISKIETELDKNNGDITIVFDDGYLDTGTRVCALRVGNVNTSTGDSYVGAYAMLGFEYEENSVKNRGDAVDITISDMNELAFLGMSMERWLNYRLTSPGTKFTDADRGQPIPANSLQVPARYMYDTVDNYRIRFNAGDVSDFLEVLEEIKDTCVSGADFKAEWFNTVADTINSFSYGITYQ